MSHLTAKFMKRCSYFYYNFNEWIVIEFSSENVKLLVIRGMMYGKGIHVKGYVKARKGIHEIKTIHY